MRILILTPWVPFPVSGACQQDRFTGFQQMKKLGHDVHVIGKFHHFQDVTGARAAFEQEKIPLTLIPHPRHPWTLFFKRLPKIISSPALMDGAALEYTDPVYEKAVTDAVENFKPDVIWMEYTTHWPVLRLLKRFNIPMIIKSSLNEPQNCIDEHGGSLLSRLKAIPKLPGERIAARESDYLLAITPNEEDFYKGLGAKRTGVLPLRGLSKCFVHKKHESKDVLDAVFLSSNYNMGHNRDALLFLLKEIVPLVRKELPGKVRFHLTGKKFPDSYRHLLSDDVLYEGFIPDLASFLSSMDIAVCPWISGQGMQQKVFEPLCRSLPLLTTHTGGYPFEHGKEVLLCNTPEDYVKGIRTLRSATTRQQTADAAYRKAESLFGENAVSDVVRRAVDAVTA